jgi:uncharacterized membrane protein
MACWADARLPPARPLDPRSRRAAAALPRWAARAAALALAAVVGCGVDTAQECTESDLTYATFGAGFMASWCRSCHGAAQSMRQEAPEAVNFDTLAEVRAQRLRVLQRTSIDRTMPPAGGPSTAERELLAEWLRCGAP